MNKKTADLITARVMVAQLLLDLWKRAVREHRKEFARQAGLYRVGMLRALREKRGYEG